MTLLSSVFTRRSLEDPNVPLTPSQISSLFSQPNVDSGIYVTEKSSLQVSTVWRCINILANTAASLPLKTYRDTSYDELPNPLLDGPHPDLTPFEFWRLSYVHRLLWGNFYAEKVRDGAHRVRQLLPIDPSKVKAGRTSDGTKVFEVAKADGRVVPATSEEVFHLPGMGYDGICGASPVRMASQGIGLALAAERHGARLFGAGTHLSGVLQTDQRLGQGQADAIKAQWRAKMTGPDAAHDIAVLDRGAKFEPITMPNTDAQFIESRGFQTTEICRWYGVPPHMVGDVDRTTSWGKGIEQQAIGFVVHTLRPDWLVPTEQRVSRELLADPRAYARYSIEGLLRGDSAARATFYSTMRNMGVYSVNEIRALENLGPVDGGDTRLEPLNMAPLGGAALPGEIAAPKEGQ